MKVFDVVVWGIRHEDVRSYVASVPTCAAAPSTHSQATWSGACKGCSSLSNTNAEVLGI